MTRWLYIYIYKLYNSYFYKYRLTKRRFVVWNGHINFNKIIGEGRWNIFATMIHLLENWWLHFSENCKWFGKDVNSGAIYRCVYKGYFHERLKLSLVGIPQLTGRKGNDGNSGRCRNTAWPELSATKRRTVGRSNYVIARYCICELDNSN